jgi:Golgi phosphoprotein 3
MGHYCGRIQMAKDSGLFLHEEIMLLVLKDTEGTVAPGTMYQYAIGGAILAELLLSRHIGIVEHGKKKLVEAVDETPVGDPLIDECLERIDAAKRRASLQTWVSRFAGIRGLKHRVARQLCQRGILQADEDKILLLFTRKVYPEMDPEPERQLINRLHDAIFTDGPEVDHRTLVLASLANSANILRVIFDKKELKERKKRIEQIVNGEVIGRATKEAIEAMQAAMMVAVIMPAMMHP